MPLAKLSQICSPDPLQKPTFPLAISFILEILWILSLALKPSPSRVLLFFPISALTSWSLACSRIRLGSVANELGLASRLVHIFFVGFVEILFTEPQRDVRFKDETRGKKTDGDVGEESGNAKSTANGHSEGSKHYPAEAPRIDPSDISISSAPFLNRLLWGATLWFNGRGIGYVHEPTKSLPPKPSRTMTRTAFVLRRIPDILFYYALMDIGQVAEHIYDARRRLALDYPGVGGGGMSRFDPWKLLNLGLGLMVYATMGLTHATLSVFAVGLGFSRPSAWPLLSDSLTQAYTLRRLWGKVWHQLFRRTFEVTTDFIMHRLLRLPKSRSKLHQYLKFGLVFLLSGLLHFAGDVTVLQSLNKPGSLQFFSLQAVGLVTEDIAMVLWRLILGTTIVFPAPVLKVLGFIWVMLWLGYTLPLWADPLLEAGYLNDHSAGTYSVILGLWNGQWVWPEDNRWVWKAE